MFSHLAPKERMAFGALALLFLGFAGYVGSRSMKPHPPIQIYESKQEQTKPQPSAPPANPGPSGPIEPLSPSPISVSPVPDASSAPATDEIMVHVAGAVVKPGLYKFRSGARIADAVQAAKGFRKDADQDQLNLAAKLVDGTQVYAPKKSSVAAAPTVESAYAAGPATAPASGNSKPTGSGKKSFSGVLDLNTATSEELQQIPGIGPSTAQHILTYRTNHGRFNSVEELLDVGGIGEKKLAKMRPYFRL